MRPTSIDQWVKQNKRHPFYETSVTYYDDLRVHAYGEYPKDLIDERRPTESETIKDFRKKIYIGKTEGPVGKVINSLSKIRKSNDYVIQFDKDAIPRVIIEDETLEHYTTEDFPKYTSLDNWYWNVCFFSQLVDSNAVSVVFTLNPDRKENEYAKPYPVVFHSDQIYDYVEDDYYFLKSNEISYYLSNKVMKEGEVYYYVDTEGIYKYSQINYKGEFQIDEYPHNLGYLPVVKLNGVVKKDIMKQSLYRSRLSPMIPELKEAVREYSDLQAGVLQSMFPSYWYYGAIPCGKCSGTGKLTSKEGAMQCSNCGGKGEFPFNPYEHVSIPVKQTDAGFHPAPTPPGGIIEKDTKIIEIQDKRVQDHIYNALASVNMEHLAMAPLNQSGTAKEWDHAEAFNFAYSIAEDSVRVIDKHMQVINDIRYLYIIPDESKREEMLPRIPVPTKFDINTDSALPQDIKLIKDAKMNPATIAAYEIEYVRKRFNTDPELSSKVVAMYELDPLSGQASDDILMASTQGWISEEDAVIHSNIKKLLDMAINEDPGFLELESDIKQAKISELAKGLMQANSKAEQAAHQLEVKRTAAMTIATQTPQDAAGNNQ